MKLSRAWIISHTHRGFVTDRDETVDELLDEAVELAKNSDVAVISQVCPKALSLRALTESI